MFLLLNIWLLLVEVEEEQILRVVVVLADSEQELDLLLRQEILILLQSVQAARLVHIKHVVVMVVILFLVQ
ncbi:MAG: hypothetical protein EBZ91_13335 [Gammaproteobacteria bacterium]|nr:hypothetical protein [Gammaproteobacteria bacterium]